MSIKTVNALSHYTDWTIGHVHSGALGGGNDHELAPMYFLIPRLFGREIYKLRWSSCTSGSRPSASFSISPPCGFPAFFRVLCGAR